MLPMPTIEEEKESIGSEERGGKQLKGAGKSADSGNLGKGKQKDEAGKATGRIAYLNGEFSGPIPQ